jgi:PPOX class probable FMN-dependent enzyme
MSSHSISTLEKLREVYGSPPADSLAVRCVLPSLDKHHRAFIALSPFLVLASADAQSMTDVSPRGDLPGFVVVHDEHTLLIPDRPGNKKLVTMSNIVENPSVALIFFVPGRTDSLRVNGKAHITTNPALLAPLAVQGKIPKSGLVVEVEQAWLHCGKALIRSKLWESEAQVASDALPTPGQMLADQIAGLDAAATDARLESGNKNRLWGEPGS